MNESEQGVSKIIEDKEEARRVAEAEKPLRDIAQRQFPPISHETKLSLDESANILGEQASKEYRDEQKEIEELENAGGYFRRRIVQLTWNNPNLNEVLALDESRRSTEANIFAKTPEGSRIVEEARAIWAINHAFWKRMAELKGVDYGAVRAEYIRLFNQELDRNTQESV